MMCPKQKSKPFKILLARKIKSYQYKNSGEARISVEKKYKDEKVYRN